MRTLHFRATSICFQDHNIGLLCTDWKMTFAQHWNITLMRLPKRYINHTQQAFGRTGDILCLSKKEYVPFGLWSVEFARTSDVQHQTSIVHPHQTSPADVQRTWVRPGRPGGVWFGRSLEERCGRPLDVRIKRCMDIVSGRSIVARPYIFFIDISTKHWAKFIKKKWELMMLN